MTGITNTATTRYLTALDAQQFKSNKVFDEITTGRKSDISVVDKILGRGTSYSAGTAREAMKQIGTGINVTNVANSTLSEVQSQIEELKLSVIALGNADGIALTAGQNNYTNQLSRISTALAGAEFGGKKLFDGSSAALPSQNLPSQSLPDVVNPWNILVSPNLQDTMSLTIARLLPGDGTLQNVSEKNTFETLFPVTDNTKLVLNALNNVAPTALNAVSPSPLIGGHWNGIDMTGSYGDQINLINVALPAGISSEQDIIRDIAINAYIYYAKTYNVPESATTAAKALEFARAIPATCTLSTYNADDVQAALKTVKTIVATMLNTDSLAQGLAKLQAIPSGPDTSYAQQTFKAIAIGSYRDAAGTITPPDAQAVIINSQLDDIVNGTNWVTSNSINSRGFPSPFYIGSLLTPAGRQQAIEITTNMSNTLTAVIANISGQQASLVQAKSIDSALFIQLSDASATYLNANYEVAISGLTENDRKITVASLANSLAENLINKIIGQLAQAAKAV